MRCPALSLLGNCILLFLVLTGSAFGQVASAEVSVGWSRTKIIRYTSATTYVEEPSRVTLSVDTTLPAPTSVLLKGPNGVQFELVRGGYSQFSYDRFYPSFDDGLKAAPDGSYSVTIGGKTYTFLVNTAEMRSRVLAPQLTNYDELQRWPGNYDFQVEIAPTSVDTASVLPQVNVRIGGFDHGGPLQFLTAPKTRLTVIGTNSATSPGETFDGSVLLADHRRLYAAGGVELDASLYYTIRFPVSRPHLPPQITRQPASPGQVTTGTKVALTVEASGQALSYTWSKDDAPIAGATNATLTIESAQPADGGNYRVTVSNTGGTVTSNKAFLEVRTVVLPPVISVQPAAVVSFAGASQTLTVEATGTGPLSYQWFHDGVPVAGATGGALVLNSVRVSDAGAYYVLVTNVAGMVKSASTSLEVKAPGRISNLSIRTSLRTQGEALVAGVTVGGGDAAARKPLLLRAVGPTLRQFGLSEALADPQLQVLSGSSVVAANDNWGGGEDILSTGASVGAFRFAPDSKDAAVLYAANPGSYSLRVTSTDTATGVVIAEAFETTAANDFLISTPRLTNVSALSVAGTGDDSLIAGFTISGNTPARVLVRAIGATLGDFGVGGVLADPKLTLYRTGESAPVATNDNWGAGADANDLAAAMTAVGAFALARDSKDAALLVTLSPGGYTAQVSGANNGTGVALVEVYEVR